MRLPTARPQRRGPTNGTKLWLYRYRFGGKRKNMSFGTFPGVGLKAARDKRHDAEKLLDQGQDRSRCARPNDRKTKTQAHLSRRRGRMGDREARKENKAKATIKRERWKSLSSIVSRDRPLCEIAPPELLTAFRRVRPWTVLHRRTLTPTASRVFQFGVGASYCSSDPTRDLKHALTKAPRAIRAQR